jgi:hypothetical protein
MNRNLLIGLVAAMVVGGGVVAYVATQNDDDANQNGNGAQTQDGDTPQFSPVSTEGLDFVGTITGAGQEGEVTFEYDKDSQSFRYIASSNGEAIETITTPDAYYAMTGGRWIKYPTGTNSGFDPESYQYDDGELANYQGNSAYQGTESCAAGTCHVWRTTSEGSESTLLIDTDTGYIVRVSTTTGGQTSSIDYEYKDVTITPPADAEEISFPD